MKRLADILLTLAGLLLLAACTDDADVYTQPSASKGNLCVYVPVTRGTDGNQTALGQDDNLTYNASVDECTINDLWLFAFPQNGKGTLLSQSLLPSPSATTMVGENVATYQLQIQPGTYRVYVVANMGDALNAASITDEAKLKDLVLGYAPMAKPGMPQADNIPMIYEPTANTEIKNTSSVTNIAANLKFTCVKVRLNVIFDNSTTDAMSSVFGSHGYCIENVKAENLSQQAPLVWGQKFQIGDDDKPVDTFDDTFTNGKYYAYDEQRDYNADNKDKNNADMITPSGEGTDRPTTTVGPWLYQTTMYLPERYVAKNVDQSFLTVNGIVTDKTSGSQTSTNNYHINLGHTKDASSQLRTLPRGTYYEIVARVKSLGNMTLDCAVNVKDWEPVDIDADFMHTTLWVSDTKAEVSSLKEAYIYYDSNVENVEFGCDTKLEATGAGQLPVIIVASHDPAAKRVFFKVNPNISIADFESANALTGTAKVWLKANNLKKYIDVKYDVKPFFDVDPVDVVIYWNPTDATERTKVVKFNTNLGGAQFPWTVSGSGHTDAAGQNSQIAIKCDNPNTTDGTFSITALHDPVTTTIHTFTLKPIGDGKSKYDSYAKQVRVTVKPAFGDYRIYMRAINDLAYYIKGKDLVFNYKLMTDEQGYNGNAFNTNWRDGWWEERNADWGGDGVPHNNYHYVYIYTQIGETKADGSKDGDVAEWYFVGHSDVDQNRNTISRNDNASKDETYDYANAWWPGHMMTADYNNPGWYYYKIGYNAMSQGSNGKGKAQTTKQVMIKPGQTLLQFSNGTYLNYGFQSHRFTHHNDPGMALFNYEDREGWFVYDPTSFPYYRVYDNKPDIVDVDYVVYTKYDRIKNWWISYGVSSGDGNSKFTMFTPESNTNEYSQYVSREFTCEYYGKDSSGNTWYKTTIHLKAPRGEYEKEIKLNIVNSDGKVYDQPLLFDGESYTVSKEKSANGRIMIEGSYDPGEGKKFWTKGKPL